MPESFLLTRVLLRFDSEAGHLSGDLSAVVLTPDGSLWVGSDEALTVERLSPVAPNIYGNHHSFAIEEFVELFEQEAEIDIEGLAYVDHYLWLTGSHSTKRKRVKGKATEKDIERLTTLETELNRYLLVRIPFVAGALRQSCTHPEQPDRRLNAGCLQKTEQRNILMEALQDDPHLGPFVTFPLPGKENGFDIEGFAIVPSDSGDRHRVFLGLRGPVLRGWAIVLAIEIVEDTPGVLTLRELEKNGDVYRKHFVDLNGMGVRELCLLGDDLIVLAGPTMDLEGAMRVFRLRHFLQRDDQSIHAQFEDDVDVLFDLPFRFGSDHAEGLALFPCFERPDQLLVVYDTPDETRQPEPNAVFADVFRLTQQKGRS